MAGHHAAPTQPLSGTEWRALGLLLPYLLEYKWRVAAALVFLTAAKVANVGVPLVMKEVVDGLDVKTAIVAVPAALLAIYGLLRFSTTLFAELRDVVFVRVTQRAIRRIALTVFRHLHSLSLRFHLDRQTGGVSRDIERGTRGISTLLSYMLFSIIPVILEFSLVAVVLLTKFDWRFAAITFAAVAIYMVFTVSVTEWRMGIRRQVNELDSKANTRAVDSLLNYETVKYFNNEAHETRRFDKSMAKYSNASIQSQISLSILNTGQAAIVAAGMGAVMAMTALGIKAGRFSIGDFVMANAILMQLYMPLNLLGMVYREITQALVDMDAMFRLLYQPQEVEDAADAVPLRVAGGEIRFDNVVFAYEPERIVLKGVGFTVPAGKTVAVVGPSGAGKSTLSRILYRFYDIKSGSVTIDGQDIRKVTQESLRAAIGIVPQDTVLFNDTVRYNIAYGRIGANEAEIKEAARMAQIDRFIRELPMGYESMVGERGLKLSGGEKQRVAIARTILKNPPILLLDEATSALDTHTEREIQRALKDVSRTRTALVIAHRLSTVVDADEILVLDHGEIVERGRHGELIARGGHYASMWNKQKEAAEAREKLKAVEADPDVVPDLARALPAAAD